ncbi:acyl-CoA N-acyltransferase [Glomus cerebriforme]|uniref:Acyl-CoA N-acyltransferase n=1 Tax=Glomus cerebriforme TaxID=658196 RepID=A0A397S4P8_9GLOM|nr:acyl-CoA N-acyltransferase [Glomus cerebriforme]
MAVQDETINKIINNPNDNYVTKRILTTDPALEMWRPTLSDMFIQSFSLAYRDVQLNLPPEQTLSTYLEHSFNTAWSLVKSGKLQLFIEVARDSSELVAGFMCIQPKDSICYIEQFVVHPDFQRMKIGSNLLKAVKERYNLIWLHTRHINEVAISFYAQHGFIRSDDDDNGSVYPIEFPLRSPDTYLRMKKIISH